MAKEYNISKTSGQCHKCSRQLEPNDSYMASVREQDEQLIREDFCLDCWAGHACDEEALLGLWRATVPTPHEKKKTFVDDEVLINFFERLSDTQDEARISFRYVLALVLMRKKLLVYDRSERQDDREVWMMHFKGSDKTHRVIDPHMDEQKIAEVSGQLGQVLEGDL